MVILRRIVFFIVLIDGCSARDSFETHFISSFIANENKPTSLVLNSICWSKREQVSLANYLSKFAIRISASYKYIGKYYTHGILFLSDLNCPSAEDIIQTAISRNLFKSPYRWLFVTNTSETIQSEIIMNLPALPDSDVVLAVRNEHNLKMIELHRPSLNHTIISTLRGFYNGTLTDVRPRRELFRRRMDLMGHPITMSNVIQDSNSTKIHLPKEDGLELENDSVPKISWMGAKSAILMLNATPSYRFAYRWGYFTSEGRWTGMIDDLNTGKADIGTDSVLSDTLRLSVAAYTDTLAPFKVRFIFRQPPLTYVSNIYALPFSRYVWIGTAICVAGSAVAIFVASRWEARFGKRASRLDGSVSDAVFLTMSAVSQQGSFMEPVRAPGRIMVWFVFLCLMALHAAYSANIVTLLQAPSRAITTLPQLAASKITIAANDVDFNYYVFNLINDTAHIAIRKRVHPEKGKPVVFKIKEGVERIRQGLFAFHSLAEPVYHRIENTFLESEKCDLVEIDYMNSFTPYVPMRKHSPYLELIKVTFKRIIETGIRSALNRRYQVPKPKCVGRISAFSSVGVRDLRGVIALMAIGIGSSIVILVVEIVVKYIQNRRKFFVTQRFQE